MRDRVTFIHTADLHLDAPFAGLTAASESIGRALGEATYDAFRRVIDTAIAREVDFVVIAGDAYNARDKSLRAQLRFREQMVRLAEHGIDVFLVHGNHDPASGWSAGLSLPENVHVFPTDRVGRVEVVRDGQLVAAVYGRSFAKAAETTNFALDYRREASDPVAIGVLHANVGGDADYDPYAPASLDDLRASGMDYWALGHIHKQEVLAQNPWIAYAGSPQGINPKETGAHGCLAVEVSSAGTIAVEPVETSSIAWTRADLDVSHAANVEDVRSRLTEACEELAAREGRSVVARFTLAGRTDAHGDLGRPGLLGELLDDLRLQYSTGDPWVWVDRIDDRTAATLDLAAVRDGADFAAEAVRVADELEADPALLDSLLGEIAAPVATTLPGYEPGTAAAELLARARDIALDELLGGEVR